VLRVHCLRLQAFAASTCHCSRNLRSNALNLLIHFYGLHEDGFQLLRLKEITAQQVELVWTRAKDVKEDLRADGMIMLSKTSVK
jgi:hypothetical protein